MTEQFRRAWRDGMKAAGVPRPQIEAAVAWHRDNAATLPSDPSAWVTAFVEHAIWKAHLPESVVDAGVDAFGRIGREGAAAVMTPTTPETDAKTIAAAEALMKSDNRAYWADADLRERYGEALERRAAAQAKPALDDITAEDRQAIERTDSVEHFADLMRSDPRRYWSSPRLQADHRAAIEAALAAPAPPPPPMVWPGAPIAQPPTPGTTV
jgi:hypothetical protein